MGAASEKARSPQVPRMVEVGFLPMIGGHGRGCGGRAGLGETVGFEANVASPCFCPI